MAERDALVSGAERKEHLVGRVTFGKHVYPIIQPQWSWDCSDDSAFISRRGI